MTGLGMNTRQLLTCVARSLVGAVIIGCNAIVGTEPLHYRDDVNAEAPSAAPAACEPREHTQMLDGDGGTPSTIRAQCATVAIDGTACAADPANVGLDLGLDGHGWAVTANDLSCLGGALLIV